MNKKIIKVGVTHILLRFDDERILVGEVIPA